MVTPSLPYDRSSGTHQRSHLLFHALCRFADVDVLHLEPGPALALKLDDQRAARTIVAKAPERNDFARFTANSSLTRSVVEMLGRELADYDLVVGRFMWGASQLDVPPHVPVVLDLDDFRYRYSANARMSTAAIAERTRKVLSHWLTRRNLRRFRAFFFSSRLDLAEVREESLLLRNIPSTTVDDPDFDAPGARLLFVGSLWYRPNREGIEWFLANVWPLVLCARPDASLRIVGAAPPEVRQAWTRHAHVEAPGFVNDLVKEYADAALVVAPVHCGGGSNIKVLESLANGRACVATRFTLAPYSDVLQDGRDLVTAADAPAFAAHCVSMLDDRARRADLARSGHATVRSVFTVERFNDVVETMVRRVLA